MQSSKSLDDLTLHQTSDAKKAATTQYALQWDNISCTFKDLRGQRVSALKGTPLQPEAQEKQGGRPYLPGLCAPG